MVVNNNTTGNKIVNRDTFMNLSADCDDTNALLERSKASDKKKSIPCLLQLLCPFYIFGLLK